jgi:hypothetical protein
MMPRRAEMCVDGLRTVGDPDYGTGNVQSFWVEVQDGYPTDRGVVDGQDQRVVREVLRDREGTGCGQVTIGRLTVRGHDAPSDPDYGTGNVQSFWVEVQDGYPTDRDGLLVALAEADICLDPRSRACGRRAGSACCP